MFSKFKGLFSTDVGIDLGTANCLVYVKDRGVVALTADNGAWSGDMTILSGGVLVSNLTALGTGCIKMHPRTALIVAVSYKDAGQSLKEKVIDRIEVQNPDNLAEADLWVSFQVQGEGLRNDVDFSAQPYLWLSAPKSRQGWQNDYQTLDGVFTPCGDTYRFGYNYVTYTETVRRLRRGRHGGEIGHGGAGDGGTGGLRQPGRRGGPRAPLRARKGGRMRWGSRVRRGGCAHWGRGGASDGGGGTCTAVPK